MSETIVCQRGPVTRVIINRPAVRNALNSETLQALKQCLESIGQDPAVDVVILTGAGDKAFCAGADLAEVAQLETVEAVRQYFAGMAAVIETLHHLPQPVIGAVFGYTLAGGMGLAAGVDLLIAADDTRFGLPEVKVGLYPMVVTAPIMRLIGPRRTLELGLTGKMIDVATAERWGFVNEVVPRAELDDKAAEWAAAIRQGSGVIARMGKEGWRLAQELPLTEALPTLENLVSLVALSADSREGIRAFQAKRPPEWPSRSAD